MFDVQYFTTLGDLTNRQELDDPSCLDEYRTACMKCLQALNKARNIVPSSFSCRDVARDGEIFVGGGAYSVSVPSTLS